MIKKVAQSGFAIVESLVSISLVSIALIGMTSLMVSTINANTASRSYSSLSSEVETIVDNYRVLSFNSLLQKFNTNILSITNGQIVTETTTSTRSKATFTARLTAVKNVQGTTPDQITLRVTGNQRRGIFGSIQYQFETIIAPTS